MKNFIFYSLLLTAFVARSQPGISWQHCYGGTDGDQAAFVYETHDHGYMVVGVVSSNDGDVINSHGGSDAVLIRYDANNNLLWQKCYGGSLEDDFICITETADHGFLVAGGTNSNDGDVTGLHGEDDIWIVRIDSVGGIIWQKTFGGSEYDDAFYVIENAAGNFMVLGLTMSTDGDVTGNHGLDDYWLLNLDPAGNLIWQKTYGGSDTDWGYQVIQTSDGGYMLSGFTMSSDGDVTFNHGEEDIWLVKTDNAGNIQWQKSYGGSETDQLDNILQRVNGNYVFAGIATSFDGDVQNSIVGPDFWLVEVNGTGVIVNQHCYGGSDMDIAWRMMHTADGGYAVIGSTLSNDVDVTGNHGYEDCWLLKLDSTLAKEWQVCFGGTDEDNPYGICQLANEDYVVTGYSFSNDGDVSGNHGGGYEDIWTLRLSENADVNEIDHGGYMKVYPNPVSDKLFITFNKRIQGPSLLEIFDVYGKKIFEKTLPPATADPIKLESLGLSSGMYQLRISDSRNSYSTKFLKR